MSGRRRWFGSPASHAVLAVGLAVVAVLWWVRGVDAPHWLETIGGLVLALGALVFAVRAARGFDRSRSRGER